MKKRIKKTGEIVDVVGFFNTEGEVRSVKDQVYYKPLDGTEVWILKSGMNFYLDFEDVEEPSKEIDWEGRRFNLASKLMVERLSCTEWEEEEIDSSIRFAILGADALIAELKKGGNQ